MKKEKFNATKYKTEYSKKYYDRIEVKVKKGLKAEFLQLATERGFKSAASYIVALVEKDSGKKFSPK